MYHVVSLLLISLMNIINIVNNIVNNINEHIKLKSVPSFC